MEDFEIKYKEYNRSNTDYARKMRKSPTPAEEKMWQDKKTNITSPLYPKGESQNGGGF